MGFENGNPHQINYYIPSDLLDDLCSRFISNLPPEDFWNLVRVCYHVELAHWFYLDNYCKIYKLRPCGQRIFAAHIFQHVPDFHQYFSNLDTVLENWREYKRSIPRYGAILLDEDLSHVLLVQSYHGKIWGFPQGKVNEDEEPWNCAAREVLEETGFDISRLINKREYINATINGRTTRLYIIANIPRDTNFKPLTQKEIRACVWFPINDLPSKKKHMKPKEKMIIGHNKFLMVIPFLKKIQSWVSKRNPYEQVTSSRWTAPQAMTFIKLINDKFETGISQELQDAFRKYLHKNFSTLNDFSQNQHQDLPTQQLKNALMIHEKQEFPYSELQDRHLHEEQCSPNNSHARSKNTSENNQSGNESKLATGRRLLTHSDFLPVEKETILNAVRKEHYLLW